MPAAETIDPDVLRQRLEAARRELTARVTAIHAHARIPLEADSSEQAAQLGNLDVVSALEAEGTTKLAAIDKALARLVAGTWASCEECGGPIGGARLLAEATASRCIDCASAAG